MRKTIRQSVQHMAKAQPELDVATIVSVDVLSTDANNVVTSVAPSLTVNLHGKGGLQRVELSAGIDPLELNIGDQLFVTRVQDRYLGVALLPISNRTQGGGESEGTGESVEFMSEPQNVSGLIAGSQLELAWQPVQGADYYEIWTSESADPQSDQARVLARTPNTTWTGKGDGQFFDDGMYYAIVPHAESGTGGRAGAFSEWLQPTFAGNYALGILSKNQTTGIGGSLVVTKSASITRADFTSLDNPQTWTIDVCDPISAHSTTPLFAVNEILRAVDTRGNALWMKVTATRDMNTYWRYTVNQQSPAAGTNYTILSGSQVLSYGTSGQGTFAVSADGTFGTGTLWTIFTHAGSPWSATTPQVYANSSGQLVAGAGNVTLDASGVYIVAPTAANPLNYYGFTDGGTAMGGLTAIADASNRIIGVDVARVAGKHSYNTNSVDAPAGKIAAFSVLLSKDGVFGRGKLELVSDGSEIDYLHITEVSGTHFGSSDPPVSLVHIGTSSYVGGAQALTFNIREEYAFAGDNLAGVCFARFTGTSADSLQGFEAWSQTDNASGTVITSYGLIGHNSHKGAGAVTTQVAVESSNIIATGTGDITNSYNFRASPLVRTGTPGTVTNVYAFFADTMTATGVTNKWAFYSAGANDKSYFAGSVGIGATSPAESFEINTATNNTGLRVVFTGASSSSVCSQATLYVNDGAAMASGDRIGQIVFGGYNGAALVNGAFIIAATTELWSATARGSKLTFYTVPNTTTSITAALVIDQDGGLKPAFDVTMANAKNIILNTSTGTKIGTGTTQKLGFWNATPVVQPSAYTQTYSTANKTLNADGVTDPAAYGAGANGYSTGAMASAVHAAVIALHADLLDTKQMLNSVIDDLQTMGLLS